MPPNPRVLFVDDDPDQVRACAAALQSAGVAEVETVMTVGAAVAALYARPVDLLVMDLFVPLGDAPEALGPRARKYHQHLQDAGGIVLLDELGRLGTRPHTLLHTACREPAVLELTQGLVQGRVRKPAPAEVLLDAVLTALREIRGG
ncbi:MAG: response regulator [Myxococcales bacterium]|nr:response regulator [Myxococcales bacterium]